jgi:hypothetical protein
LIILSKESQIEFLQKFIQVLGTISYSNYYLVKWIAKSDKFEETLKDGFLKSVFEKAMVEYQYKMLFDDKLIDLQQECSESQIELLQKLGSLDIYRIKTIIQTEKIEENIKQIFLKSAFEKASAEHQYKMLFYDTLIDIQQESSESQLELLQKHLIALHEINFYNYDQIKSIAESNKIEESVMVTFLKTVFEKANAEYQYRMLFEDNLIDIQLESTETQIELLRKMGRLDINRINSIAQSEKIEGKAKEVFMKSAFEKAIAEHQYKMLFVDNLIDIEEESPEDQTELLRKLGRLDMTLIKSIEQSNRIKQPIKDIFLKSVFEKADADYQYKMLFEDNLIDIKLESTENQIELLRKIGRLDLNRIKSISQSDKIKDQVKEEFMKSSFENASFECQYKMVFDDCLVQDLYNNLNVLLITTASGRVKFLKGQYGGKTYFEVLENDIEYLHKNSNKHNLHIKELYTVEYGHRYSLSSTYKQWKESWISILEEINKGIEDQTIFVGDSFAELYKKMVLINDARELYEIFKIAFDENHFYDAMKKAIDKLGLNFLDYLGNYEWLACVKKYNQDLYNALFEQNYHQISKIDRLRLWLQNLNPYYNYLELVQSAWQLSNDERKLLNKRIKEHAKDERLQRFIDQIPMAELIDETETTKTYKCKWRNLYYKNGSIQVFFDKTTSSEDYLWESARVEWNLLTQEYFNNRRIDDIITTIDSNNQIMKITGLEDIEVRIVIAEVQKYGTTERKVNITTNQVSRIIHNISARNQCINFLASQNSEFNVLDIQELVTNDYGSLRRDVSFLFPIPNGTSNIYLIWESAEFEKSKATHIFKCSEDELEDLENKIKDFIESNVRTRSRLNSVEKDDIEIKKELKYFCRVNHDSVEYEVWENRMRETLPFLK